MCVCVTGWHYFSAARNTNFFVVNSNDVIYVTYLLVLCCIHTHNNNNNKYLYTGFVCECVCVFLYQHQSLQMCYFLLLFALMLRWPSYITLMRKFAAHIFCLCEYILFAPRQFNNNFILLNMSFKKRTAHTHTKDTGKHATTAFVVLATFCF